MKRIYSLLALLIAAVSVSLSSDFIVNPILIDYYTIEYNGAALAALGSGGCAQVSFDKGEHWIRTRPFSGGVVIKMDFYPDSIVTFNSLGEISVSIDKGKSWINKTLVKDSIIDIVKIPEGYFLRGSKTLYSITNELTISNSIPLYSNRKVLGSLGFEPYYKKSMTLFKGDLIVSVDSLIYIRVSKSLNIIDSLDLSKHAILSDSVKFINNCAVVSDSTYIYFVDNVNMKQPNGTPGKFKLVLRSNDFKEIRVFDTLSSVTSFSVINNKIDTLKALANRLLYDESKYSNPERSDYYKDYTFIDNEIYVVGFKSIIFKSNLMDSSISVYSDASWARFDASPIIISDSLFFLNQYVENNKLPFLGIYKTNNNGVTIYPTLDYNTLDNESVRMYYKYYDTTSKIINYIASAGSNFNYHYTTDLNANKYYIKNLDNVVFDSGIMTGYKNAHLIPEMQKLGDKFVITLGVDKTKKKYTKLALLDSSFNKIRDIVALDMAVDYYYAVDTLTYFVHCANMKDSASEVRYTTDAGENWTTIAKYDPAFEEIYVKDVTSKGKTYIMLAHRNNQDSKEIIDIIDLDSRYKLTFEEWSKESDPGFSPSEIRFLSDENFVYITRGEKLYAYPNLLDKSGMRSRTFPNGGRVVGPITKYGARFIATYEDDYNAPNLCILEPEIPLSANDEEAQVERVNYLYCFPPYPVPAKNEVRALIYWDTSIDIEKDDISVYNLFSKVAGREDITIEKTMPYSGYLVWNCSRYEPGVYFIVVNHGDAHRLIKAIVE